MKQKNVTRRLESYVHEYMLDVDHAHMTSLLYPYSLSCRPCDQEVAEDGSELFISEVFVCCLDEQCGVNLGSVIFQRN